MFILILCLVYTVFAKKVLSPVSASSDDVPHGYSRTYLRGLKRVENERIQAEFINRGITYIEHSVFTAAKKGLLSFTTRPFQDCEIDIYDPSKLEAYGDDKAVCENIVNGIKALVSERFPDSKILYDTNTRQYTLKWD